MSKEQLKKIIDELYDKYNAEEKSTIFDKFVATITQLPVLLENTNTTIKEREKRKNKLEKDSDSFIQRFLNKYNYYYNSSTELFFEYNQNKFSTIKEDDIQHKILSSISENKELTDWKHKIKVSILKKIKDRELFTCIPESVTIQHVINILYPNMFDSKESCKYFLTVLGDYLLKKCNLTYFINPKMKPFIKQVNDFACMFFGSQSMFNYFKFKYYDHKFSSSRLISSNNVLNLEYVINYLKEHSLDIFCVAVHYSIRYQNGDTYLEQNCLNDKLKTYALYLRDKTDIQIINHFCEKNIESSEKCSISWKNLQFLWKQFIDHEKIPNILFANNLKTLLMDNLNYDSDTDVFLDCTSKYLPTVSKFIKFWAENIKISESYSDILEIDEICSLFFNSSKCNITEKSVLDLIKHYYPDIVIEDNKYVYQINCVLWDKRKDINQCLKKYKSISPHVNDVSEEISINEIYELYCEMKFKFIASKQYFEKFIKEESELNIIDDNLIKVKSFDNILLDGNEL
jgi:hypothetical protein